MSTISEFLVLMPATVLDLYNRYCVAKTSSGEAKYCEAYRSLKHASDLSSNTKEIPNKEALDETFQGEFLKEGKFSLKSMIIRATNKSKREGVG